MTRTLASLGLAALIAIASLPAAAASRSMLDGASVDTASTIARKGADDGAGKTRRGRGTDDGANHARKGADDGAGNTRRGRGRGADDARRG